MGCHQPIEKITGTQIPAAWFSNGMRIIDIARPRAPKEVARFIPDPPPGTDHRLSNDVFVDDRGLIFLFDRHSRVPHPGADVVIPRTLTSC